MACENTYPETTISISELTRLRQVEAKAKELAQDIRNYVTNHEAAGITEVAPASKLTVLYWNEKARELLQLVEGDKPKGGA